MPEPTPPSFRRCAACSADLSCENTTRRCSRCKKAFFCDKTCQLKAHPIHKHHCEDQEIQKESQLAADCATTLGDAARSNSSCSPKPLKLLQKKLEHLITKRANGTSLSLQESYTALFSAVQISDYFRQGPYKDFSQAETYLLELLDFSQSLNWTSQSDSWIDLIKNSRFQTDFTEAYRQISLKRCKTAIASAEKHQDIHLLAMAYSAAAEFTLDRDRRIEWKQHSRQLWMCMTKAALLQGEIGTCGGGAQQGARPLLGDTYRLCEWVSERFGFAEAEQLLLEVQQYTWLGENPPQDELNLLVALSNYTEACKELPPENDQHRMQQPDCSSRAANYRQQLFVALSDQGKPVATNCGLCNQALHAHKEAGPEPWSGVFVSYCCHLLHTPCALSCPTTLALCAYSVSASCPDSRNCLHTKPERSITDSSNVSTLVLLKVICIYMLLQGEVAVLY